ncbi:cell wall-binding repeat-containing protein [Streptomyces diastatochromogenes]|uniref:cell wall-binding repeat-containing protein n=1 Tax=Streptomyces diastatochromogenes TaxID=42236 RepID=UPI0036529CB2
MRSSRSSARRRLVALGAAAALSAGTVAALAPGASADAGWTATNGILTGDLDGYVSQLYEDGTAPVVRVNNAMKPAWSPDGSRLAYVNQSTGRVNVVGHDFKGPVELPVNTTNTIEAEDPTFWWGGSDVVFSLSGRLRVAPSDGSRVQQHLFATAQEGCDSQPSGAVDGKLAFIRSAATCGGVDRRYGALWLYDGAKGTFKQLVAGKANGPAVSPDGTKVAYTVGGKLYTVDVATGAVTPWLPDETGSVSRPAWSPDGTKLAYELTTTSNELQNQLLDLAGGTTTVLYDTPTTAKWDLAWQPLRKNLTGRVWGSDTYATNIASSRWTWNTVGGSAPGLMNAKSAVLVNRDSTAYSLTAPALAGKKHGPVLGTPKSGLSSAVKQELKRVLKPGSSVYLVGGTSVLGSTVASQVTSLGFTPKRLSGADRYATSVAVAKSVTSTPKYVFLADGTTYASALPAAAAAGANGTSSAGGVVLTNGSTLTSSVKSYLNSLDPRTTMVIAVGSSAKYALTHTYFSHWPSTFTYYPITAMKSGRETAPALSVALAKFWWSAPYQVGLAADTSWRGGVSAGAAMNVFGPVLWTDPAGLSSEVKSYLVREAASTQAVIAFGGNSSVSPAGLDTAGTAISAGAGQFVYHPYYNGTEPVSPLAARAGEGSVGADPHLDSLRTTHRQ